MGNSASQAKSVDNAGANGPGWLMQSLSHLDNDSGSGCGSPEEKNNFLCCIASRYITKKNSNIKTSLNWALILGRTAYICEEKNFNNDKNGRLSVALLPAEGTLSLMMYQYIAHGVHGNEFDFESSLKSKQTTDFSFFSRMTISPTKLLQLNQSTDIDSKCALQTENDNAFCGSDVIQIELALQGTPYSDRLEPLLPINNEKNKLNQNRSHCCGNTHTEPYESVCEDPCTLDNNAMCGYSQNTHYDIWLRCVTDNSSWTHIQMESSGMVVRNTGIMKTEVNFQRDFLSILQKALYSVESNFENGLNETIYTPNDSEIEIIIFCSYGSLLISNETCLNFLMDNAHSTHKAKENVDFLMNEVPLKKGSENLITSEHVEKTSVNNDAPIPPLHRSYINIVENDGNFQLQSSTGSKESSTETEEYLKALYNSVPSNLNLINGMSQCSVVQLRLKAQHLDSSNCAYGISSESQSLNEKQKLKVEWNILQVHGGSALVLQQYFNKYHQTINHNNAMRDMSFTGNDHLQSELNMHILTCYQLCDALNEWFTALNPNLTSSNSEHFTCTLSRLNDVQKSFTTARQAVVFFTSQPYRSLRVLSCFNSASKPLLRQCFEYCLRGELPTLRVAAVQWMIGYSFTFFKMFGWPNYEKMSSMHGDVFKTFSCGIGLLLNHQNKNALNESVVGVFRKAFSETEGDQSNSFYTFRIQEVLLTFIDCCFLIFLDKSTFPACLRYNICLLNDKTKEITPLSLILQLYQSFINENSIGQDLWTNILKLRISHFAARLCSLLQRQCQEKTLFESTHTSSQTFCGYFLELMNIKECLQQPCPKKIHEELSSQKWSECYHLCEQTPVENSYRALALIDYYRFKKEWVDFSFPLYETNIFLQLAKECLKVEQNVSFEVKLQAQFSHFLYLNASLECGKILYLVELELNVPFFSRLLRHPSARKELKLELHPHIKNMSTFDSTNNKSLQQDIAVVGKNNNPSKCQSLPTVAKFLYHEGIFKSLFPFKSKLCETRIEFMNFVEVTETLLENQVHETHSENSESLIPSDAESIFLTPINASAILDTIEWFKLFCWVIHFPSLEWYPGCHLVSPNTIVTAVVVNSQSFTNDQVLHILKNEIYHSASVLALKQLSVTTSAPFFLIENVNSRVDTDKSNFFTIVQKISSYTS